VSFLSSLVVTFFIALGVELGGSLLGGLGAVLTHHPPLHTALELADRLKIWALVTALGGTFEAIKTLEISFLGWQPASIGKQVFLILAAFVGAHLGFLLMVYITGGKG